MHQRIRVFRLIVAGLILYSGYAGAAVRSVIANDNFFEGIPVAPDMEILMVSADLKVLPHGDADAELIQYPAPGSGRLSDSCGLDSTPPVPFTLDCGAQMLGLETRADETVYYFLSKAHQGDWYQIILSPQSGKTVWVKDQHVKGLDMTTHLLVDWLQSGDSYVLAHEVVDPVPSISVLSKPDDRSEVLTECVGYADGDGLVQIDKIRNGDWVHATCLENECFATQDPERACTPLRQAQGIACVQGWARWRGKNGHLMLYPHEALSEGC